MLLPEQEPLTEAEIAQAVRFSLAIDLRTLASGENVEEHSLLSAVILDNTSLEEGEKVLESECTGKKYKRSFVGELAMYAGDFAEIQAREREEMRIRHETESERLKAAHQREINELFRSALDGRHVVFEAAIEELASGSESKSENIPQQEVTKIILPK